MRSFQETRSISHNRLAAIWKDLVRASRHALHPLDDGQDYGTEGASKLADLGRVYDTRPSDVQAVWYQSFAGESIHFGTLLLAADCTGASVVAVPACRYAPVPVGCALSEGHEVCHGYRDSVGFIKRVSVWKAFRGA